MNIIEQNGSRFRIRQKELKTPQTEDNSRVATLRREFSNHPSSGLTPSKLASILNDAERGNLIQQCYLAEDIEEKDGHIQAELFKRKMALTGVDWTIEPPKNATAQEQEDAENIEQILKDVEGWQQVLFNMADAILKGFSNTEISWQQYRGMWVPNAFEHIPASWFQLNQLDQREIRLRDETGKGQPLRPLGWLAHRHYAKSGYPARIGLVRQLSWPFIFKNYSVRDLAEYLEIYGIPARLGMYPSGATDSEKNTLLQAVMNLGHNAAGIIPKGMEIEYKEAARGAGSDPYTTMMSWCERVQSKVILGQTLTAQVDSTGSQALGNVHNEVRKDICDNDINQIAVTLNRDLIYPLYMLNGKSYRGDPRRKPKIVFDTQEPEDLKLYSEAIPALVNMGMQIPVSYAHEKLKIPKAQDDEEVLGSANNDVATPTNSNTSASAPLKLALAALRENKQDDGLDVADGFSNRLKREARPVFNELMKPVEELVQNAESLEQLLEDLLALENQLDVDEYTELLQHALAAADLAGRFEVSEGR